MSHSDSVKALPTNGVKLASTHDVGAAYKIEGETTYAIQYIQVFTPQTGQNARKFFSKIAEVQNFTPNAL
jgi:GMP synthase (glutamine-hydrolysing)